MCNCPPDAYFVEVNGDGDPIVLTFEGLQTSKWCPDGANSNVARGNATVNCGASGAEFSACANSDHGPPCLDMGAVAGTYGTYVDRSGRSWSVTAYDFHLVEPADALTGSFEGNYTAMVSADGGLPVAISGNVHVCGWVSHPLTPCH
jgi:hypothetical protein